jgi:hypothetical protein
MEHLKVIIIYDEIRLFCFVSGRLLTKHVFFSQIVVDTLMLSGTNPSLMLVREWILQGKIVGEQAVQAISALVPTVETPTKELLTSFMVNDKIWPK